MCNTHLVNMRRPSSTPKKAPATTVVAVIIALTFACFNMSAIGWQTLLPPPPSVSSFQREQSKVSFRTSSHPYIDASVIVSGIAKNIQPDMARTMVRKLRKLGGHFREYHIVIYENNSNEKSRQAWNETFHEEGRNDDFTFRSETLDGSSSLGGRTAKIARARNVVLEIVHQQFADKYDYMIVTDLDGCCDGPDSPLTYNPAIFRHAIHEFGNEWDALSFQGHPVYWDRWAFREENVMPFNMFGSRRSGNAIQSPSQMEEWIQSLDKTKLKPILSAFMMISIYRINATRNCLYSGVDEDGEGDCEHVAFHRDMREKNHARIRLWPVSVCHNMTETLQESEANL